MALFNEENDSKIKAGVSEEHYFDLKEDEEYEYYMSLFQLGDIKPFAPVLFKIFYENGKRIKQPNIIFLKFEIIDDENFICYPENWFFKNKLCKHTMDVPFFFSLFELIDTVAHIDPLNWGFLVEDINIHFYKEFYEKKCCQEHFFMMNL